MKRLTLLLLALCQLPLALRAQQLVVTQPFQQSATRDEAVSHRRIDYNRDTCAMVIVSLEMDEVDFEGDIYLLQYRNNEWWIWMSPGATWLTVLSEYHTPLRIEFPPVRSATTYTLGLGEPAAQQALVVTTPLHADPTMVDASRYKRTDARGRTCALLRIGLVTQQADFTGAVHKEYRRGEWWVWMPAETRSLTVRVPDYSPLTVQCEPLQSAVTYLMTIHKMDGSVAMRPADEEAAPAEPALTDKERAAAEKKAREAEAAEKKAREQAEKEALAQAERDRKAREKAEAEQRKEQEKAEAAQRKEQEQAQAALAKEQERERKARAKAEEQARRDSVAAAKRASRMGGGSGYDGTIGTSNLAAALKSTVVPGWGQMSKGHTASGVATLGGEALLAGGAVLAWAMANHQQDLANEAIARANAEPEDSDDTQALLALYEQSRNAVGDYADARQAYQTWRAVHIGCLVGVAAVHVYNIVRAATMKPRSKGSGFALVPSITPSPTGLNASLGITFNF